MHQLEWLTDEEYRELLYSQVKPLLKHPVTFENTDILCRLNRNNVDIKITDIDVRLFRSAEGTRALRCLTPTDPEIQLKFAEILKKMKPGQETSAGSNAYDIYQNAASFLRESDLVDSRVQIAVVDLLKHPLEEIRYHAFYSLKRNPILDLKVQLALLEILKTPRIQESGDPAGLSADLLGHAQPKDPAIFSELFVMLQSANEDQASAAVNALGDINPKDPETLSKLTEILQDNDRHRAYRAVTVFRLIAKNNTGAQRVLAEFLVGSNREVADRVASDFWNNELTDEESISKVAAFIRKEWNNAGSHVQWTIRQLRPKSPKILEAIRDIDPKFEIDWIRLEQ
ncbi:MAG: HEAT repeat domain-containing protein [Bdellovibrionota bacterium]